MHAVALRDLVSYGVPCVGSAWLLLTSCDGFGLWRADDGCAPAYLDGGGAAEARRRLVFLLAVGLYCMHFARRCYESVFVHVHRSVRTLNLMEDVVGEFAYYWLFGAWMAYDVMHLAASSVGGGGVDGDGVDGVLLADAADETAGRLIDVLGQWRLFGILVWFLGENVNTWAHREFARLATLPVERVVTARRAERPAIAKEHARFPRRGLFELISCPHYFGELVSWAGFALVAQTPSSAVFLVVATGIMGTWANQRHQAYLRTHPDFPATRRRLIPFIW